ncbi:MAG: phosphate ABC transporter permease PstA [Spirochaetales bacterium]|nr:phosphate ABC transporter permease PstA [Spirochaetales bacterium]
MKKISTNKTNARLFEKIAKGFLWIAAGMSIVVLLWIIGSILFQGFIAISDREYPVIARGSMTAAFDAERKYTAAFLINSGIRTDELTAQDIIDFYSLEKTDWVISAQDLDVSLFSYEAESGLVESFRESVFGDEFQLAFTARPASTEYEMLGNVAATPGAIGYIDSGLKAFAKSMGVTVLDIPEAENKKIAIIVNKTIGISELSLRHVVEIFLGDERKWNEGGVDIVPYIYTTTNTTHSVFIALMQEGMFKRSCTLVESDHEMIEKVGSTPGAIGFIPEHAIDLARQNPNVKIVTVRSVALFVNPAVMEIKEYRQLRQIAEANVSKLFSGAITNYSEIDGIDLPVVPILYKESTRMDNELRTIQFPEGWEHGVDAISVETEAEFVTTLSKTPGGIGFGNYFSLHNTLVGQVLPVRRQEITQNLTFEFLTEAPSKSSRAGGVSTIIGNTILLIFITLLFAVPFGIGGAVYLVEYSRQGMLVNTLRFFTETLAGIPSIIYGLFGYILFRIVFGLQEGILSAGLTLMIMILPTIIRTAEEALKSVPKSYRFESFALGATKWQTIRRVILPAASPGIVTGIILGVGRAIGETAAVLFTCGSSSRFVLDQGVNVEMFTKSARVLALHIFFLFKESAGNVRAIHQAYATSAILIIVILGINLLTAQLLKRMNSMRN